MKIIYNLTGALSNMKYVVYFSLYSISDSIIPAVVSAVGTDMDGSPGIEGMAC